MNLHPSLRLTPSNSPFYKSSTPRSPTRSPRHEEPGLQLRKVIGTTTASALAFDSLPSARQFVFTAGNAAVLTTVDDDLGVSQQFFRANPSLSTSSRELTTTLTSTWPLTPTPNEARGRTPGLKEQGAGNSPLNSSLRDWPDSPSGRTTAVKDRVKAASSVAISPNGKWLAIGETGYRPRILIFATKDGTSETPVAALAEHAFGVHALAFSPDSRYLASLGNVNDGFLFVWNVDDRTGNITLNSSNKCKSVVHDLTWMGHNIVTVGLRFVKVWRPDDEVVIDAKSPESNRGSITPRPRMDSRYSDYGNSVLSPKHRILSGKNVLLQDMLESTFISAIAISDCKALVCAESGEVCFLDWSEQAQSMRQVAFADFRVTTARSDDAGRLHVFGTDNGSTTFDILELETRIPTPSRCRRRKSVSPTKGIASGANAVVATATLRDKIVEIRSNRMITLSHTSAERGKPRQIAAHDDGVLGVHAFRSSVLPNAAFLTFSGNGTIQTWDDHGHAAGMRLSVPLDRTPDAYGLINELRAVTSSSNGALLVTGDKFGTISLLDVGKRTILQQIRAHSAEIQDIIVFERAGAELVASASRDRTVQLFVRKPNKRLELVQTMDEHAAAVAGLLAMKNGDFLLSCAADRSVVVREAMQRDSGDPSTVAFAILRTISLKSSPTSMCLTSREDHILVATADRCIGNYSLITGQPGFSFKCTDQEGGDACTMSRICFATSLNGSPTIASVSSSDKSIRLYSEYGSLIARDWGHTEGITDMALIFPDSDTADDHRPPQIVTVAADSTIFLWDSVIAMSRPVTQASESNESSIPPQPNASLTPLGPPLRKVISYSEISRFRREKSADDTDPPSPPSAVPAVITASPQKLRKKTSRMSVAQPPRLEPSFRSGYGDQSRRRSLRHRSPSPPSPRNHSRKESSLRRPSLGMSLRSKSTEMLNSTSSNANGTSNGGGTSFGSLTAATESVCRTLRTYRRKLALPLSSDTITPDALRELEKELKLTARMVGERSHGKTLDEATMAKLLEQASDKIALRLDQAIKERLENEVRKSSESLNSTSTSEVRSGSVSGATSVHLTPPVEHIQDEEAAESQDAPGSLPTGKISSSKIRAGFNRSDTAPGLLEKHRLVS